MRSSIWKSVRSTASSLVLSAALVSATVSVATVATISPAVAAISLTTSQTASLQTSLTAAILAANGNQAAIEAAIAQATENAIAMYGLDAAGSIASAVLSIAESAGATGTEIGDALGQASAFEASTSITAANAIASTIANEGKSDEVAAYETTATSLGYSSLASIAGGTPAPVGESGGGGLGGIGGSGFTSGGAGGGGGGCLNPSCTSL